MARIRNRMDPSEFEERAKARWGNGWKRPMARYLECDPKTVRNYLAGEQPIPAGVADRVRALTDPVAETVTKAILDEKPTFPERVARNIGRKASTELDAKGLIVKRDR